MKVSLSLKSSPSGRNDQEKCPSFFVRNVNLTMESYYYLLRHLVCGLLVLLMNPTKLYLYFHAAHYYLNYVKKPIDVLGDPADLSV